MESRYFATASLSFLPTLNLTAVVAATSTMRSVPGTFAFLAARAAVLNVPKPMKLKSHPALKN